MCSSYPRIIDQAVELDSDTARVHLTRFLLVQATHHQRTHKQWTLSEIAAHLGTGRAAVGRTLRSLTTEGLIRQERGRLVVTNAIGREDEAALEPSD